MRVALKFCGRFGWASLRSPHPTRLILITTTILRLFGNWAINYLLMFRFTLFSDS